MLISGLIVILIAMVVSRMINKRGYRLLTDDEKLRLMDGFSKDRAYSLIPILALIGLYWFLMTKTDIEQGFLNIGYFVLLIAYILVRSVLCQKKLTRLNISDQYKKLFTAAQVVSLLGLAWFFFTMFQT